MAFRATHACQPRGRETHFRHRTFAPVITTKVVTGVFLLFTFKTKRYERNDDFQKR